LAGAAPSERIGGQVPVPDDVAVASIERFNEEEWQNLLLYYTHTARARPARALSLPPPLHAGGCTQLCRPPL